MITKTKVRPLVEHQIERLLLSAHTEGELGIDLIDEYFQGNGSLDLITERASALLEEESDPLYIEIIRKNLSECVVVKMERDRCSLFGLVKRVLGLLGITFQKSTEIHRAERVIESLFDKAS